MQVSTLGYAETSISNARKIADDRAAHHFKINVTRSFLSSSNSNDLGCVASIVKSKECLVFRRNYPAKAINCL
jgi:hypothetical protein